jgi:hypothetical protein
MIRGEVRDGVIRGGRAIGAAATTRSALRRPDLAAAPFSLSLAFNLT